MLQKRVYQKYCNFEVHVVAAEYCGASAGLSMADTTLRWTRITLAKSTLWYYSICTLPHPVSSFSKYKKLLPFCNKSARFFLDWKCNTRQNPCTYINFRLDKKFPQNMVFQRLRNPSIPQGSLSPNLLGILRRPLYTNSPKHVFDKRLICAHP